LTEYAGVV